MNINEDNAVGRANRVVNADCLEAMKSIESGSIDLILTDPPYG